MVLIKLLNQLIPIIGIHLKTHVHSILIVVEITKNAHSYFGQLKMMEVRPTLLDQLAIIGTQVHAVTLRFFLLRT